MQYTSVMLSRGLADTSRVKEAFVDSHGVFRFDSLPPADYVLSVRSLGYQRQWHAVRVLGGGSDTLCVRMRTIPMGLAPVVPTKKES